MANEMNTAHIRWGCRRGMLELDILLQPFFDQKFSLLSAEQQADFVRLLDCNDPELYAWLMGHEQPEEPAFKELVQLIKNYAVTQV